MPKKRGRKTLWEILDMPERLTAITGWAMQGSTDKDIYEMLGISKDTFYEWKRKYSEFADALKKGRFESNGEILNSAFTQTQGHYIRVTEPMKLKDVDGSEHVEMVTYDKFFAPNPTMTIFMLKNRMPEHFKDKQQTEISGEVGVSFVDDVVVDAEEDDIE